MKFSIGLIATIALSVVFALLAQALPAGKPKPVVTGNGRCRGKLYYTGNGMLASLEDVIAVSRKLISMNRLDHILTHRLTTPSFCPARPSMPTLAIARLNNLVSDLPFELIVTVKASA